MNSPHYQVDCVWGSQAITSISQQCDVAVWVDVFQSQTPAQMQELLTPFADTGVISGINDAFAVAQWISDRQLELQKRLQILLICAGNNGHDIANELAAGAVVERLAQLGIDAMSPEAAVANAAYSGLKNATAHLIAASRGASSSSTQNTCYSVDPTVTTDQVRILF